MNGFKLLPAATLALIIAMPATAQMDKSMPGMAGGAMGGQSTAGSSGSGSSKATATKSHKAKKHHAGKHHAKAAKSGK